MTASEKEKMVPSHNEQEYLAAKFDRHADEEGKILDEYRVLSEKLGNSSVGNLVSHILTEEELHHLLLRTMATWLRERPGEHARSLPPGANRSELLRITHKLQQHERETIDACRNLKPKASGPSAELLSTLLDAMILDSEKHHRLLAAVEQMLKA
jgi:hypothetical protein